MPGARQRRNWRVSRRSFSPKFPLRADGGEVFFIWGYVSPKPRPNPFLRMLESLGTWGKRRMCPPNPYGDDVTGGGCYK